MAFNIPSGQDATKALKNDQFTKLFKPGTRFMRLKQNAAYYLRVLPAFNPAIAKTDPAYKTGYTPYRDANGNLTPWLFRIMINRSIGPQGMDFFSPKTFGGNEPDLIEILYMAAKNNPAYAAFVAKGQNRGPQLSPATEVGLINVIQPYKPEDGVRIVVLSKSAFNDLVLKVGLTRDNNLPPVEAPFGDKYQWGDITDPFKGLVMFVRAAPTKNNPAITVFECDFQQFPGAAGVASRMSYPLHTQEMFNSVMGQRVDIPESIQVLQQSELLEYLNSVFPRPLIELAFGQMVALPPAPVNATYSTPPQAPWGQAPAAPAAPAAPWGQPPPQAAPPAAMPPAAPWGQPPPQAMPPPAPYQQPPPAAPMPPAGFPPPAAAFVPPTAAFMPPPPAQVPPATSGQWPPAAAPAFPPPAANPAAPVTAAPPAWTPPAAAPSGPAVPTPAATLPGPTSALPPPPQADVAQAPRTGNNDVVAGADGLFEGFQTKELAVEYRQLTDLFMKSPDAAKDQAKVGRMMDLIRVRKGA